MKLGEKIVGKFLVSATVEGNSRVFSPTGYLSIVFLALIVLVGFLLVANSGSKAVFAVDENTVAVATNYKYEVDRGRLTVTLVQSGVKGWKVIEVENKGLCDNARSEYFETATKIVDSSEASQSVTITTKASKNYCFWALRDTDNIKILYAYVPADYIRQADKTSIAAITADYMLEFENGRMTVRLKESGVKGWQAIEVDSAEACKTGSFANATKIIDSSEASQSVTITLEASTSYCFWALRDTDDIRVILSFIPAEKIAGFLIASPTPPTPPDPVVQQPAPVVDPIGLFLEVTVLQTEKDSVAVLEVVANRPITQGSAVRIDLVSSNQCNQSSFADESLLRESTSVENGKFYITLIPEDHEKRFCLQIKNTQDGHTNVVFNVSLPISLDGGSASDPDEDEKTDTKKEKKDDDKTSKSTDDNKKDDDKTSADKGADETSESGTSFLFPVIIVAGAVGIIAIVVIIVIVLRKKPKGF